MAFLIVISDSEDWMICNRTFAELLDVIHEKECNYNDVYQELLMASYINGINFMRIKNQTIVLRIAFVLRKYALQIANGELLLETVEDVDEPYKLDTKKHFYELYEMLERLQNKAN